MNMWSMMEQVSRGRSIQNPAGSEGLLILLKENNEELLRDLVQRRDTI